MYDEPRSYRGLMAWGAPRDHEDEPGPREPRQAGLRRTGMLRAGAVPLAGLLLVGCDVAAAREPAGRMPDEVRSACGSPGATVELRQVPVTIRHADCDLSGVYLTHRGAGSLVPEPGEAVGGSAYGPSGSRSVSVSRHVSTKDVTFTVG